MKKSILVLLMLICAVIFAQNEVDLTKKKGEVKYSKDDANLEELNITKKEYQDFSKNLDKIVKELKQTKILQNPIGFSADVQTTFPGQYKYADFKKYYEPVPGNVTAYLYQFVKLHDGTIEPEYNAGVYIDIDINSIQGNFLSNVFVSFMGVKNEEKYQPEYISEDFYFEPKTIGSIAGCPMYDNGVVVATLNNTPLFIPLTQKEYIEKIILLHEMDVKKSQDFLNNEVANLPETLKKEAEEREKNFKESYNILKETDPAKAEEFKKEYETALIEINAAMKEEAENKDEYEKGINEGIAQHKEIINKLKAELEVMTDSEKNSQAYYLMNEEGKTSMLADKNTEGVRGLVKINKNIYNNKLPKSVVQLIIVHCDIHGESNINQVSDMQKDKIEVKKIQELYNQINWENIFKLLGK